MTRERFPDSSRRTLCYKGSFILRTTFTAQSKDFNSEELAKEYVIDNYWTKGTKDLRGRERETSGLKFLVTDEEDANKHFEEIKLFLLEDNELIQELKNNKMDMFFDIGFTINTPEYISRFLNIDKDILKLMADAEVGLSISSYLASEDD